MEIEEGCYEMKVKDEKGNVIKVKVENEKMKVVDGKVKR